MVSMGYWTQGNQRWSGNALGRTLGRGALGEFLQPRYRNKLPINRTKSRYVNNEVLIASYENENAHERQFECDGLTIFVQEHKETRRL